MSQFILHDFHPLQISKPISQEQFLQSWAYYLTLIHKINSSLSFDDLYNENYELINRYGVSPDYISQRQTVTMPQEFSYKNFDKKKHLPYFFPNIEEEPQGADIQSRMEYFDEKVLNVFDEFYSKENDKPDDLIHATCTGYLSPSPAQKLAEKKGWLDVTVTHSYHMGCYGAFPPVRMATGFLAASKHIAPKKERVDIVHTEMSSCHYHINRQDAAHIVNMTLFADGFIRYSVSDDNNISKGLKVIAMQDHIIKDSLDKMSWIPGSHQFDMVLSREVPIYLRNIIEDFSHNLCEQAGINFNENKNSMIFAIHPGGPKILNHVRDKLQLEEYQVKHSRDILFKHGNMSSATIPHIWKSLLDDKTIEHGQKIVTMAFGPGLTATGFILEVVKQ